MSDLLVTADRKPDKLPTTVDGAPMEVVAPGPITAPEGQEDETREEESAPEEGNHEAVEEDMTFESDFR